MNNKRGWLARAAIEILPIAPQTQDHLKAIRSFEASLVLKKFGNRMNILEVGAGNGYQSRIFADAGYNVEAIDVPPSNNNIHFNSHLAYQALQYYPVNHYDGKILPYQDNAFDVIYTSSVLEHIVDKITILSEMQRVLRSEGIMIHVLPNARWRLYSSIAHVWKKVATGMEVIAPPRHGELGTHLTETYYFSDFWWGKMFSRAGLVIQDVCHNQLVYTGDSICDSNITINSRKQLSLLLGSVCTIYTLRIPNLS
jgi:2-polyprenyl-3-methyl-5-hydroxy-6-metoxy-1,4-benzoquinol methylase